MTVPAVRTAIVRHRTRAAWPWAALGAGLTFFALSCIAEVLELAAIGPAPRCSASSC